MSDLHHDLIRIHQETGNARAVANPRVARAAERVEAAFDAGGRLRVDALPSRFPAEWDGDHLVLGPVHIWYSPSERALRAKFGAPTSDTDGQVMVTL